MPGWAQSFSSADLTPTALISAQSLDAGDYDNDGDLDLLVRWNDTSTSTWKAEIFSNTSTVSVISFVATGIILTNVSGSCIWADLNNDGKLDILASGFDGAQNFLTAYINEAGTFAKQIPLSADLATSMDWGDVDADGDQDLLITTATESLLLTRTNGKTFNRIVPNAFSVNSILVDYDLDSDLDVIGDGIYSNRGTEFLETHALFPTPNGYSNYGNTYGADLDGDGDRDFIRAERSSARGSINYYATAYFNQQNIFSRVEVESIDDFSGGPIYPIGASDFDNNGDVEMVYTTNGNRANYLLQFKEVKSGRVTSINLPANSRFHSLGAHIIADFNGDQKMDIITTGRYVDTSTGIGISYAKSYRNLTVATNSKPTVPTNLGFSIENSSVTFSWNKSTDAETPAPSIMYNFYLRQGLDTIISSYTTKSGKPRISSIKGSFEANKFLFPKLPNNGSYYWAVQAKDFAGNYSTFSPEKYFEFSGGNSAVKHLTSLTDQSINYDPKNDQFILVGIQNGNVYGVLLDGKFGEKKSSLKKLNQFSTVCKSPKVAVDSLGNYLVSWIGDSLTLATSLWGKFIKNDLTFSQANEWRACEKLFYGLSSPTAVVNHDVRYNPARNSFDMGWAFLGETGGVSVRRVKLQSNLPKPDPIKNITWTYVSGYLHGARGYRDISLDSDPKSNKSMVVYAFENERVEGGLTSLGKIYFQELDQNLVSVKDSVLATSFTYGSAPHILFNPYLENFAVIWNAHFQHQATPLPQDGYNESRDVVAAILSFAPIGTLTTYIFPTTISKTQQQGGQGGALNPNLSFNYDRNEFFVSWHNTNANKLYGQRINPLDKTTVTADEFQLEESLSEFPKVSFANKHNHFLMGFLQDGNGTTSIMDIPNDPIPHVISLSKKKAMAGEKITITGGNFGKTPFLNSVHFGSIKAKVDTVFWDQTKLQVTVPFGLTRDKVPVIVSFDGQVSNVDILFENITVSGITSVVPLVGKPGDLITIVGTNFPTNRNNLLVKFGPVVAAYDDFEGDPTDTQIKVRVPLNAVRGKDQTISVIIQDIAYDFEGFQVVLLPTISLVKPNDGSDFITGKKFVITGMNFRSNPEQDNLVVKFGDYVFPMDNISSPSIESLTVLIPKGLEGTHKIYVSTTDGVAETAPEYMFRLGADIKYLLLDNKKMADPNSEGGFKRYVEDDFPLEVEVFNDATVKELKFWSKGISAPESEWKAQSKLFNLDNRSSFALTESELTNDFLGLQGYFEVVDSSAVIKRSDTFRIFHDYIGSGTTGLIPDLRFGGNSEDYNIVSIPYELSPNKINTVFKSVLDVYGYDMSKWRILHYKNENQNGDGAAYQEYLDGLDDIDPGKGYWIIVRNQQDISFDFGKTLNTNYEAFKIVLNPGWNQIGNPYDFNVSWDDIIQYNTSKGIDLSQIESFKTFKDGSLQASNIIDRFRGGFVRNNGTASVTLEIPFNKNASVNGGRIAEQKPFESSLSEKEWRVALDLSAGELKNAITSFGMHPRSQDGEDVRDEHRLPVFIKTLDASFPLGLSASIVGTADQYSWEFEVFNTTDNKEVTIHWDNTSFGKNDRELFLHDRVAERLINMRDQRQYTFTFNKGYHFNIHFGDQRYIDEQAHPERVVLSDAYPNPMRSTTTIPFTVSQNQTHVLLAIYNLQGQEIRTLVNGGLSAGFYEFEWDGKSATGEKIASSVVVYRLQTSTTNSSVQSIIKKLVITP